MALGFKKADKWLAQAGNILANWRAASAAFPAVFTIGCLKVSTTSLPEGYVAMDSNAASIAASFRYTVTPSQEKNVGSSTETW